MTAQSCGKHEERLARAATHADYMQKQLFHVSQSLFALADAVAGLNDGEVSPAELVRMLDELTVPHSGTGTRTLQQVLDSMAEKAEQEEAMAA